MSLQHIDNYGPYAALTSAFVPGDRMRFPTSDSVIGFANSSFGGRVLKGTNNSHSDFGSTGCPYFSIADLIGVSGNNDIIIGFPFVITDMSFTTPMWCFRDAGGGMMNGCNVFTNGIVQLQNAFNATSVAVSTKFLSPNIRYMMEIVLTRTSGTITDVAVYIDGDLYCNAALTFSSDPNDFVQFSAPQPGSGTLLLARALMETWPPYIADQQAGLVTTRIGPCDTDLFYPTGETSGQVTGFTRTGGTGVPDSVGVNSNDGDTSYYEGTTVADQAVFDSTGTLSVVPNLILGVRPVAITRKEGLGVRKFKIILRSGGSNTLGPEITLASGYQALGTVFEKNPDGDIAWTKIAVEAAAFGAQIST